MFALRIKFENVVISHPLQAHAATTVFATDSDDKASFFDFQICLLYQPNNSLTGMIFKIYQLITDFRPFFCGDLKNQAYFAQSDQVIEIWDFK